MIRARDNPFATEHVLRLRYRFADAEGWRSLLQRLQAMNYRASITGPHGSGKTTLLEDLGVRLQEIGFRVQTLFLNEQNRSYPAEFIRLNCGQATRQDILLFDGCEQLGPLNWRRFLWQARRAGGLIVTTHRPGRLPVLWECQTTPDLLGSLVRDLVGSTAPTQLELDDLYRLNKGNLREAFRQLYDSAPSSEFRSTIQNSKSAPMSSSLTDSARASSEP